MCNLLDVKRQTLRCNTLHESFHSKFRGTVDSVKRHALYSSLVTDNYKPAISLLLHQREYSFDQVYHRKSVHIKYCLCLVDGMSF